MSTVGANPANVPVMRWIVALLRHRDVHGYRDQTLQPAYLPPATGWAGGLGALALCAVVSHRRRGRVADS